ncbi:hypothetical protein GY45DRAFT_409847 [Cubamyces sp. BRFM 1775]|nr:hypothetical protein GY45DRAFT_409847 [Cubamyces sp. BRFM 1775]
MFAVAFGTRRAFIFGCLRATHTVHSLAGHPHFPRIERSPGVPDSVCCHVSSMSTHISSRLVYISLCCRLQYIAGVLFLSRILAAYSSIDTTKIVPLLCFDILGHSIGSIRLLSTIHGDRCLHPAAES